VETFRVGSNMVGGSDSLRLDASYYNRDVIQAIGALEASGMDVRPLGELTERAFIPPRFRRIYVKEGHGIPFLQGSHVVHFEPADMKYLSPTAHVRLGRWIIEAGWILVTCSGTVGRVTMAPDEWNGWAASQHILRIVPGDVKGCPPGYLATFLASPLGHVQLTAQIYGAVVDELTEDQARSVLVPVARTPSQLRTVKGINDMALDSVRQRAEAVASSQTAMKNLTGLLPSPEVEDEEGAESTPYENFENMARSLFQAPKVV
jgi:type I restriction enzyme S subunit